MTALVRPLATVGRGDLAEVGGKAANLGELIRAGFEVPPGVCVTTRAFELFMAGAGDDVLDRLDGLGADDLEALRRAAGELRSRLEALPLPPEVERAVVAAWLELGEPHAYAVRSSATAEDLPHASFAGQQDSFLNVRGRAALLAAVRACFVSLFSDRAVLYRIRGGFGHRRVALAAVVQRMVEPEAAGVLFTADPVSGHRDVASIDAAPGLGEALVQGVVSADLVRVDRRTGRVLERRIGSKEVAVRAAAGGGTERVEVPERDRARAVLSDAQAVRIAELGGRIEALLGGPQDVEWALAGDVLHVLQARPITALYPLPEPPPDDDALHVYFSLSHLQVMTDPVTPLALSWLRTVLPVPPRFVPTAGGRFYADLSPLLRHPLGRRLVPRGVRNADALAARALAEVAARPEFRRRGARVHPLRLLLRGRRLLRRALGGLVRGAPEGVIAEAEALMAAETARVQARLEAAADLRERLAVAREETRRVLPTVLGAWAPSLLAGMAATALLHALLRGRAAADDLDAAGRGLTGNVATEMNLAVGDLSDLARASDALLQCLGRADEPVAARLEAAAALPGGPAFRAAWEAFLARYGARGPAEIDLRRPRWSEDPASLLAMVLAAARQERPGAHREHHARLAAEGERAVARLLARARRGPLGPLRGAAVRRLARVSRALLPLREHHKFFAVQVLALVKPVLLAAGRRLAAEGRLEAPDDVWFLHPDELAAALDGAAAPLRDRVREREAAHAHHLGLTPPRVMTSRGEVPAARLDDGAAPAGALVGSPVSGGVVEGPARVVLDPARAALEPGEILVAPATDPGWTPLFVNAAGLVTEVGGLMTHGSLVAREYGIPAVVGVVGATSRIRSGQRLRVHGREGWVELLDDEAPGPAAAPEATPA